MSRPVRLLLAFYTIVFSGSACLAQETVASDRSPQMRAGVHASSAIEIGQVIRDCVNCPEMVAVPQVGQTAINPGRIFYAGRYEVTWREYLVAVREGACPVPQMGFGGNYDVSDPRINDSHPLTGSVGPDVFKCYLEWLNKKTGKNYRIPSASEWEHVARSGAKSEYYWGDGLGWNNAIVYDYFDAKALRTQLGYPPSATVVLGDPRFDVKLRAVYPVGQFKPNAWGIYDVIGNAAEITTEAYPPLEVCTAKRPVRDCEMMSARGNIIVRLANPMKPNPPITESLTTTRYRASAHHGTAHVGFRLVRD